MQTDFYDKFQELRNTGNPFALATVVRAEKPTSAKVGAKAIITEDGTLSGWIGGSCAEPTVKRETKKALQDGQPRLIRLCPPEKLGQAPQEGVIEIALTCISGGTLEIYIEPQLAQPHLVVIGHLATAEALIRLGKGLGWRISLLGLEVTRERFPDAGQLIDELDFSRVTISKHSHIVVASHGNYDEDMLVAALQSEAPYVALIASKKRAGAILQYLNEANLTQEQIARLKYPAGLDFGAVTPEEIALSILAEIIQRRRQSPVSNALTLAPHAHSLAPPVIGQANQAGVPRAQVPGSAGVSNPPVTSLELPVTQPPATEALDPVCGMTVEIATAYFTSEYNGKAYYFCAAGCKRSFDKDPGKYVQTKTLTE